jgi:hypothetical protein
MFSTRPAATAIFAHHILKEDDHVEKANLCSSLRPALVAGLVGVWQSGGLVAVR